MEENLDGNESKKEAPIETQGGSDSDGHKNGSPVNHHHANRSGVAAKHRSESVPIFSIVI